MGASGAGKSTLLHLIGALDAPAERPHPYDGVDVTHFAERPRLPESNAGVRLPALTTRFRSSPRSRTS
ncbi:MAG: hypothetical protein R3A78_13705 [Polyangiales bacterium]